MRNWRKSSDFDDLKENIFPPMYESLHILCEQTFNNCIHYQNPTHPQYLYLVVLSIGCQSVCGYFQDDLVVLPLEMKRIHQDGIPL